MIHGVFTGRFRRELTGSGRVIATKFRPGGFHPFHPVPAHTLTNRRDPGQRRVRRVRADRRSTEIEDGLRAHGWEDDPRVDEIVALHAAMLTDPRSPASRTCARSPAAPSARSSGCSASTSA